MRALGLEQLFSSPRFGGFGSDFCSGNTEEMWRDRAQLVRIAAQRCAAANGGRPIGHRFHVGGESRVCRAGRGMLGAWVPVASTPHRRGAAVAVVKRRERGWQALQRSAAPKGGRSVLKPAPGGTSSAPCAHSTAHPAPNTPCCLAPLRLTARLRAPAPAPDTPMDLQAAVDAGAVPVGVTTGIYSRAELEAACPGAIILDDMSDLEATLRVFGLSGSSSSSAPAAAAASPAAGQAA